MKIALAKGLNASVTAIAQLAVNITLQLKRALPIARELTEKPSANQGVKTARKNKYNLTYISNLGYLKLFKRNFATPSSLFAPITPVAIFLSSGEAFSTA